MFSSVLLPDPLGPTTTRNSPTKISSDTWRTTSTSRSPMWYVLLTLSKRTRGVGAQLCGAIEDRPTSRTPNLDTGKHRRPCQPLTRQRSSRTTGFTARLKLGKHCQSWKVWVSLEQADVLSAARPVTVTICCRPTAFSSPPSPPDPLQNLPVGMDTANVQLAGGWSSRNRWYPQDAAGRLRLHEPTLSWARIAYFPLHCWINICTLVYASVVSGRAGFGQSAAAACQPRGGTPC